MDQANRQPTSEEQEAPEVTASPDPSKEPWQEPKLAFIEPKLTTHGSLEDVTAGFFGGFTP